MQLSHSLNVIGDATNYSRCQTYYQREGYNICMKKKIGMEKLKKFDHHEH